MRTDFHKEKMNFEKDDWIRETSLSKLTPPASIMSQYAFQELVRQVDMSKPWERVTGGFI